MAFTAAATAGDLEGLIAMLAQDATMIADGGPLVFYDGNEVFAALSLGVVDECIQRLFFHADTTRLRYLRSRQEGVSAPSTPPIVQ